MIEKQHIVEDNPKFRFAFIHQENQSPWSESQVGRVMTSGTSGSLKKRIIQLIDSARNQICACSFIIANEEIENALLLAEQRGVRVYLLTSAELNLKTSENEDWGRDDEIRELHKKMLTKLAGNVYLRSSGHFHAKYLIVDKNQGVMTTCNFTTKALMENPEIGIELNATECVQLWKLFQYQFWEGSEKEMLRQGTLDGVRAEGRFPEHNPTDGVRCSHPSGSKSSILEECLSLIESAQHSITLTSYGWGNKEISKALKQRLNEGIDVSIIGRNHRGGKQTDFLQEFKEFGCSVYGLPLIHAKSVLIDPSTPSARGLVMSANFDNNFHTSHDLGICLNETDSTRLATIIEDWKQASLLMIEKKNYDSIEGRLSVFTEGDGWRNMTIENHTVTEHRVLKARSVDQVDLAKPKFQAKNGIVSRVHEHRWTVEVPRLPKNATEEEWLKPPIFENDELKSEGVSHELPVFVLKNGVRVIAIDSIEQSIDAKEYKAKAKVNQIVLR
jgi:cardiolipin synthase A/B